MKAKQHDCGAHGFLTVAEIARRVGVTPSAIAFRVREGWRGERLLAPPTPRGARYRQRAEYAPRHTLDHARTTGAVTVYTAVRVAQRWPGTVPSIDALRKEFGMSRATAYRWRDAIRDALGRA